MMTIDNVRQNSENIEISRSIVKQLMVKKSTVKHNNRTSRYRDLKTDAYLANKGVRISPKRVVVHVMN